MSKQYVTRNDKNKRNQHFKNYQGYCQLKIASFFYISIEICSNDDNDDLNVGVWNLCIVDNNLDESEIKGIYSDDDIGSDIPKYGIYVG